MTQVELSRVLFVVLLLMFLLVRGYFTFTVRRARAKAHEDTRARSREATANLALRRFVLTPMVGIGLYLSLIDHEWMQMFFVPYRRIVTWIGAALGFCGIGFLIWVHVSLGKEWSAKLRLNKEHRLIQSGPYAKIRHPMYTALFAIYFGFGLITSNYLVIIVISMIIMSLALRVPTEEQVLIERFGEEYLNYQQRTGKFLPKN